MPGVAVRAHNVAYTGQVLAAEGYMGVYNRIIKPVELRPGDRVIFWYPFTPTGYVYQFRQCHKEPGLDDLAKAIHDIGATLMLYLPCITTGDTWNFSSLQAKRAEIERLYNTLPPTAQVIHDEGANIDRQVAGVTDQRKGEQVIGTEPCMFTYSPWSQTYPESFELTSHYNLHPPETNKDLVRIPERHTLIEHHPKPPDWDRAAFLRDHVDACRKLQFDFALQAEPMVLNETGTITMEQVCN